MDKPMRTKVADYIDKVIETSKKDGDDDFASNGSGSANGPVSDS
jgi:protein MPE1